MAKIEKEVKVLNIDVEKTRKSLDKLGAKFEDEKNQKLFVYDIPTLYYRFLEIGSLLNSDSQLLVNTNIKKLEILMLEFTDLVEDEKLRDLEKELNVKDLNAISTLPLDELRNVISNDKLILEFKNYGINPNKWIRLRESNSKTELTTKHVFNKNSDKFQKVLETEIKVSSLEETNKILESIGIVRRSYQEKIRYSYTYKEAEIEIDMWPLLDPYLEIETENEDLISEIIDKLGLKNNEVVSLNTEQLYERINIDVHSMSELKF